MPVSQASSPETIHPLGIASPVAATSQRRYRAPYTLERATVCHAATDQEKNLDFSEVRNGHADPCGTAGNDGPDGSGAGVPGRTMEQRCSGTCARRADPGSSAVAADAHPGWTLARTQVPAEGIASLLPTDPTSAWLLCLGVTAIACALVGCASACVGRF
jgi:hypothetical protein